MSDVVRAIATSNKFSSTVTVNIGGYITTVNVARDVNVATGDAVLVQKNGILWTVIGRSGGAAPAPLPDPIEPPPAPAPALRFGSTVVTPIQTGTRQGVLWRLDDIVIQGVQSNGENNLGAAFYGSSAINTGLTCTRTTLKMQRPYKGDDVALASTLWLVTESSRPAGAVTLGTSTPGPALRAGETVEEFELPTAWGQAFMDGTAGGLAVYEADGDPYVIFAGRTDWSPAFTLTIEWKRG